MHLRYSLTIVAVAGCAIASPLSSFAPLYVPDASPQDVLNNSYIVMFHDDIPSPVFNTHLDFINYASQVYPLSGEDEERTVEFVYNSVVAKGYTAKLSPEVLQMIRRRPEVRYVEQEKVVYQTVTQKNSPWGLARISHRDRVQASDLHYEYSDAAGAGVMIYVIDSGVYVQHREFEGRAIWGKTFFEHEGHEDSNGHGTHVAGTAISRLYGVAKKAEVTAIKAFGAGGQTRSGVLISAIEWAVQDAKALAKKNKGTFKGAVINMSLSCEKEKALNEAANKAATKAGVHVVVAAGNYNKDACNYSPASASEVITVGATNIADEISDFSNYGKCVDVLAPGERITSCGIVRQDAEAILDGTSMAAPHVSGLIAYFLSIYPSQTFNPDKDITVPSKMKKILLRLATKDKVIGVPISAPNLMVFNNATHNHLSQFFLDQEFLNL